MSDVQKFINTCTTVLNENINEQECELLSSAFQLRKLAVDEILLREGEQDDTLYIVIDGDVIVTRDAGGLDAVACGHVVVNHRGVWLMA